MTKITIQKISVFWRTNSVWIQKISRRVGTYVCLQSTWQIGSGFGGFGSNALMKQSNTVHACVRRDENGRSSTSPFARTDVHSFQLAGCRRPVRT